jgi:hypothetical protein
LIPDHIFIILEFSFYKFIFLKFDFTKLKKSVMMYKTGYLPKFSAFFKENIVYLFEGGGLLYED